MSDITTTVTRCQLETLTDRSATGKERPWKEHKVSNEYLAMAYDEVNPAKAARLRDCATDLFFRILPDGVKRLEAANFCRIRLCPMCQWRRGLKLFGQATRILQAMGGKWKYIFLTLTVSNCQPEELGATITHVLKSWSRLTRVKAFKEAIQGGYMRSMEITHNLEDDTYHPHIHAILAVNPSYFKHDKYITQAEWTAMWADAARLDYKPIIHVQRCKGTSPEAIAEAAKYAVKVGDYLIADDWQMTVDTVRLLDRVLTGRRFVSFGGTMAQIKRQMGLDDVEDGDLVHIDDAADKPEEGKQVCYSWASGYQQYIRER